MTIPLIIYLINNNKFHNTIDGWSFWILGLLISVSFEQFANYKYMTYSKIANKKSIDSVQRNITINKSLRIIAMCGFILCILAVAIMVVSKDGTIANIW